MFRYFIMQKGEGWGADHGNPTGDWYGGEHCRCQGCPQNPASIEHMFTFGGILQ